MADADNEYSRWKTAIERENRRKQYQDWCATGNKIQERYRDEATIAETRSGQRLNLPRKFNILWSNVQTLLPYLFSRVPEPQVRRQFKDQDPVGRTAAQILERAMQTDMEADDLEDQMARVTKDYLLPGRGLAVVNYHPDIESSRRNVMKDRETGFFMNEDGTEIDDDDEVQSEGRGRGTKHFILDEEVKDEAAPIRYVYWKDVLHADVKTWKELSRRGWIAFREEITKKEARERFGKDIADRLSSKADEKKGENDKIRPIYEIWQIWDPVEREVLWVSLEYPKVLDKIDDPLELDGFFPTPRFLNATTTNETLIPIADYHEYKSQATQLDEMTQRMSLLVDALKVSGVYDKSFGDLANLLKTENKLIGIDNWAATGDKGLRGVIAFVPLEEIVNTLQQLTVAREQVKQDLYEITGIADIIRGQSNPLEAKETNQMKGRFATMRLSSRQREVQRYIRDLYQLKAEVMVRHFEPETLLEKASWLQSTDMQVTEQDPQKAMEQQLENQMKTQAAIQLLKSDEMATFRLDVETDATIAVDDQEERMARISFMEAMGGFMGQALEAGKANPALAPLLGQMILFGVRGWNVGRELEGFIEDALEKLRNQPPPQPPPDPAMEEVKRRGREDEMQARNNQEKNQIDAASLALDWQKFMHEAGIDDAQLDLQARELVSKNLIEIAKDDNQAQTEQVKAITDAAQNIMGAV